jgi:hypothetical protein
MTIADTHSQRGALMIRIRTNSVLSLIMAFAAGLVAWIHPHAAFAGGGPMPIAITNPGFEDDPVAPGCFAVFTPNGWSIYDPNSIYGGGNAVGGLYPEGGPYFPMAPEGNHVGIVFLGGAMDAGPVGLSQVLGETLQADTIYTLSAEIGDIDSGTGPPPCDVFGFFDLEGFPGYQVQLLAGGVVLGQDDNSLANVLDEGVFLPTSFEVMVSPGHPQIGQPLEIRLINLNMIDTPAHPGIEVDFDDIRLTSEPACGADGDIDNDGAVDIDDAELFIGVLLGSDGDADHTARSDMDCSGTADADDLQAFVTNLLN